VPLESIVVIALVTALAALMVFLFVGYTDQAKNERYVFEAREHTIAVRAVLSESSATSDLTQVSSSVVAGGEDPRLRSWSLAQLSEYATGNEALFQQRATELIEGAAPSLNGSAPWELWLIGPASTTSLWDADGFLYITWPEEQADQGPVGDDAVVYVTYRVDRIDAGSAEDFLATFWQQAAYNPQVGFETYRFS
jgi:type II secretory pathway pseudopilin PulG